MTEVRHETIDAVLDLLTASFGDDIRHWERLGGGAFSNAYGFEANGQPYVIRLNAAPHAAESFSKDAFAARHFASTGLPIPEIIQIGSLGDGQYAVSERVPGQTLFTHTPAERHATLPSFLAALTAIGQVNTSATTGYGDWGADGQGKFASWQDYLSEVIENHEDGFYANWHALFDDTFLERDTYDAVYRRMLELLPYCPNERSLIHNDLWFENILADNGVITGVIDWANALYGDPLYDVARLVWGSAWPGWWYEDGAAVLRERFSHLPNYAERITCYACHLGLDDMRYYAKMARRAEYDFFQPRLLAIAAGAFIDSLKTDLHQL